MNEEKDVGAQSDRRNDEPAAEEWVPLSVRESRKARERRDRLWPYVWMNFASIILLFVAAVIMVYRIGAQSCH